MERPGEAVQTGQWLAVAHALYGGDAQHHHGQLGIWDVLSAPASAWPEEDVRSYQKTKTTRKLEDMYGTISVTVFPKSYEETAACWVEDTVVIVTGVVQVRRDEPGNLCDRVERVKAVEEEMNRKHYQVWLRVHLSGDDDISVSNDIMIAQDMYRCLQEHPGRDHYDIFVTNGEWEVRMTPADNTMHYTPEIHEKLETILGKNTVEAVVTDPIQMPGKQATDRNMRHPEFARI